MKEIVVHYESIRHMMKSGDVINWHSDSALGWLIRKFSKADVNHSSTIVRTDELGSDRVFITEANPRGIELHALSDRLKDHRGEVYWLQLRNEHESARYGARKWAVDHIDVGYDYGSLFKQVCGRVSAESKKFFCSEFSFMALRDGGKIQQMQDITIAPRPGDMEGLGVFYGRMRIK